MGYAGKHLSAPDRESIVPLKTSDLRGAARLVTDATAGLTDLVEAMHERIARVPGLGGTETDGRTSGVTGLVYKSIRGATRLVGGSIDGLLALLGPTLALDDPLDDASPERQAVLAALNGVLGDYLVASGNPLATPMSLCFDGRPLALQPAALRAALPGAGPRPLVLLHGLCMNDRQWCRAGHDHGAALAADIGASPVYLRYNSGQHVSINGRLLSQQLERLLDAWPVPVQALTLLGHSMGGLLARSALHHADLAGHHWPARLTTLVFLGTPHHGAPLERAGNWVDILIGATPYASPFARLGKVRSAGITDLRHGNVLDEDWVGTDRFAHRADRRGLLPLPDGVRCFAMAGSLGGRPGDLTDRLLGDGLVPLDSALGRHRDARRTLAFAPEHQWVGQGVGHLDLLDNADVYLQLKRWLT